MFTKRTPYTKVKSKWIKHLNVRSDTKTLLEENIGRTCFEVNHRNIFLDPSPRVMKTKTKIKKKKRVCVWGAVSTE